jgi:hypothetical protein
MERDAEMGPTAIVALDIDRSRHRHVPQGSRTGANARRGNPFPSTAKK